MLLYLRGLAMSRVKQTVVRVVLFPEGFQFRLVPFDKFRVAGVIEGVAFFAYATPRVPENALAVPLRAAGIEVHLIGDCQSPRDAHAATADGHAIGNAL